MWRDYDFLLFQPVSLHTQWKLRTLHYSTECGLERKEKIVRVLCAVLSCTLARIFFLILFTRRVSNVS